MEKGQDSFAGLDLDVVESHASQGVAAHLERRGHAQAIRRGLATVGMVQATHVDIAQARASGAATALGRPFPPLRLRDV
ncbi:hypothetical protein G6F32_015517 [Rhizopus arrhizus]|nr:hypothetical protein G6F32_015517 [Rhizopus arrhizus]